MVGCPKQLWGVLHYLVLLVLWEITVGHIAYDRLYIAEYVFPDIHQENTIVSIPIPIVSYRSVTMPLYHRTVPQYPKINNHHMVRIYFVNLSTC